MHTTIRIPIKAPPKPKAPAQSDKLRMSAEATARAELATLAAPKMLGRLKSWDDVQRYVKPRIPALFREDAFTDKTYNDFKSWYISTAADRLADSTAAVAAANKAVIVTKQDVKVAGVNFRPQQRKAIDGIVAAYQAGRNGAWLPLGTGRGKTFVAGGIIQWFKQAGHITGDNMLLPEVFFFTKKKVVLSTKEKIERHFGLKCATDKEPRADADVLITHYQSLSTKHWAPYFRTETISVFSQAVEVPVWVPRERIVLIILDECHELKKIKSKRTQRIMGIARAAIAAGRRVFFLAMSATNATTLDDTRWFNYCTGLTDDLNGSAWLQQFVSPIRGANTGSKIKTQMERYTKAIGPMYVRPPNDPLPYKIVTTAEMIDFPSEAAEQFYRAAEEDYIKSIEVIGGVVKNLNMAKFTLFRSAAEYVKAEYYAHQAYKLVQSGRSVIIVVAFKRTLTKVLSILASLGVKRDNVSILKGNDQVIQQSEVYGDVDYANVLAEQDRQIRKYKEENDGADPDDPLFYMTRKEKAKFRKTRRYNQEMVRAGETRYEQQERTRWLLEMDLGKQTDESHKREIDRFLNNQTHYLLMTFAVGGTGIDADDRIPKELGGRPRTTIGTVCYNAEEWLQGFGRDARVTTLTDVEHIIPMFNNSIESQHVLPCIVNRLNSMSAMTGGAGDIEGKLMESIAKSPQAKFETKSSVSAAGSDLFDGLEEDDDEGDDDDE